MSKFIYLRFCISFLIFHFNRLFNDVILFKIMMIVCAAYEKLNDVWNWQIEITYAFYAWCVMYWLFDVNFFNYISEADDWRFVIFN